MLGCHDFCGYYEWTFHYLRCRFGTHAVKRYWSEAIASDSQQHYIESAQDKGLRGLYESWLKTGDDEQCDWSVTLDEQKNLLRLDMRQCPSKGFLIDNQLNADEDYCDHCMGWIGPALSKIGAEVAGHEHNHCGQCWWDIRERSRDQPNVEVSCDIRKDSRWQHGYLDRYVHGIKLPVYVASNSSDYYDVLSSCFQDVHTLAVVRAAFTGSSKIDDVCDPRLAVIASGHDFVAMTTPPMPVRAVILEHQPENLMSVAEKYHAMVDRPLLLHAYLPGAPLLDLQQHGLLRAVPILPLLIRAGVYSHSSSCVMDVYMYAVLLAAALQKRLRLFEFSEMQSRRLWQLYSNAQAVRS